ncbi:MAG TPA: hypothetical protein VFK05_12760, partial [Polyangiaceae bacterium]|nr:hypothetical protein [Polyangiaceae bacterium]
AGGSPSAGNAAILFEAGGAGHVGTADAFAGGGGLPAQPMVGCAEGGGDNADAAGTGEECSSPPPVCADSRRLVYYSSGVCVAGACRWTVETLQCPDFCSQGACVGSFTVK